MTFARFRHVTTVSVLVLPVLLGLASRADAQTAEEKARIEQAEKEGVVKIVEEVTVTGSMIPRKDLDGLSPVTVVNVEEVTYQGTGRVEDLIQALPQVFAAQNSTYANGASGTATVQLRNLGSQRTLVLLNGRRMASGDAFENASDLNFIPAALVKRVDVLTGGASSVYGADAVAGVVNFVLDTEFQGFKGEVQWNGFQHNNSNDLAAKINKAKNYEVPTGSSFNNGGYNFNLAVGGKFGDGKGHASAYIDYRDISAITKDSRDYTNCSVSGLGATEPACGGSGTWQYGRFIASTGKSYVLDPRTGNTNTFRPRVSANDLYNFAPLNYMQRPDTSWRGGGFAHYEFSKNFVPYVEVMFMDNKTDAQIAPSGSFGSTSLINCDNPMLSAQQRSILCGTATDGDVDMILFRRNVEGGGRTDKLTHVNWRVLGGIRGEINPTWRYDVYGLNAKVDAPDSYINDFDVNRLQDALFVVGNAGDPSSWQCRSGNPGCAPWNVFTVGTSGKVQPSVSSGVTQAAVDYVSGIRLYNSGTNTKVLGAQLTADLGKNNVKLPSATEGIGIGIGGELRKESLFIIPDEVNQAAAGAGQGGPVLPIDGSYTTREVFLEARIPLVQDTTGAQDLTLELGYRMANNKVLDQKATNNHSFKGLLSWAPIADLRLRGGFNRAVRAPNIQELFRLQGLGLNGTTDICAGENPSATQAQCALTGVSAAQYGNVQESPAGQYNSLDGGNPELTVEKASTITAGLVVMPKAAPGLSITLDYYDIKIEDQITSLFSDDIIQKCATSGNPALCNLIHRDRLGTLWLIQGAGAGFTESTNQNIGDLRARGIDVGAGYPWNLGDGGFVNFQMLGSFMLENKLSNPLVEYDCAGLYGNQCGAPNPKWRHRLRATWNTKSSKASVSLNWRFLTGVTIDDLSDQNDLKTEDPDLIQQWKDNGSDKNPATHYFDIAAGYKILDKMKLTVGCNNILDKEPPMASGVSPNDFSTGMGAYDPLGRSLYANLQFEF